MLTAIGWLGQALTGWPAAEPGEALRLLLAVDAALLLWRTGMRGYFTSRWYGPRQALLALPRAFFANVIAILAARRAVMLYWRILRSGQVLWEKTEHLESQPLGEHAPAPVALR